MRTYYAIRAAIRYYGPGFDRRWPDPPHRALANLRLDDAALQMFTRRYGPLYFHERWPKPDALAIRKSEDPLGTALEKALSFVPDLHRAMEMQRLLIRAWRGEQGAIAKIEHGIEVLPWFGVTERVFGLKDAAPDGLTLYAKDMWNFIRAAFLLDYKAGRAKVCKNSDCPTPYFLQARKGQKFCSHKCAVLIAVRRFRNPSRDRSKGQESRGRRRGRRTKR